MVVLARRKHSVSDNSGCTPANWRVLAFRGFSKRLARFWFPLVAIAPLALGCHSETAPPPPQPYTIAFGGASGDVAVVGSDGAIEAQIPCDSNCSLWNPRWSRDGSKLSLDAVFATQQYTALMVVNKDGSGLKEIARALSPCFFEMGICVAQLHQFDVDWAPDGRLVFAIDDTSLAVASADGSGYTVIFRDTATLTQPRWAPGGQTITFTHAAGALYSINARDGTGLRLVTNVQADGYAWAPDGHVIAAITYAPEPTRLFLVDPANGTSKLLALVQGNTVDGFCWSPSSKEIVFLGDSLGIVATDGRLRYPHYSGVGLQDVPRWSSDGANLIGRGTDETDNVLAEFPPSGGTARIISTQLLLSFAIKDSPLCSTLSFIP